MNDREHPVTRKPMHHGTHSPCPQACSPAPVLARWVPLSSGRGRVTPGHSVGPGCPLVEVMQVRGGSAPNQQNEKEYLK